MKLTKAILSVITLVLLSMGCREKDEFAVPVKVNLKIMSQSTQDQYYTFTEGCIGIKRIEFAGIRESGGNIYFETDPEKSYQTTAFGSIISSFDIPQGIYYYMEWDVYLKQIMSDELSDLEDADSFKAGMVIRGAYWPQGEGWGLPYIGLLIVIDDIEKLEVRAYDAYNNSRVVLSENTTYEAHIILDLDYAFESISGEAIMNAEFSGRNNEWVVISSSNNKDLYTIILDRIFRSAKVVVK
jgi:hypothetical protein